MNPICLACRSVCPTCGGKKDYRAVECLSCGMSTKAKAQWGNEKIRAKMMRGLAKAGKRRQTRYDEIKHWFSSGGRAYGVYRDEHGKRCQVYRYRWLWTQARGPIPAGMVIHHLNGDSLDDRLENLTLMSNAEHVRLHSKGKRTIEWEWRTCPICGKRWECRPRKERPQRYCSASCYHAAQRSTTSK